jgi:endonuclease/exonuclease/phosphatase (EEP) superfamily protein YafD
MTAPPGWLARSASPTPSAPGHRRRRGIARYLAAAVFTLVVAIPVVPDLLFVLDRRSPFVQLVSMRPWILLGAVALLAMLLLVFVFERRALPFVIGVLVVVLAAAGLVLPRVLPDSLPTTGTPFRVLAFNTYEGEADADELAALIEDQQPDAVAVIEAGVDFAQQLEPLVEPLGYELHTSTDSDQEDVEGVVALVSERYGDVDVRIGTDTTEFPYLELTGGELGDLRFVAFHAAAPVPGLVPAWNEDLALLSQWCAGPTPAVIAGDFNATLDHSALRAGTSGCGDAAEQRGEGLTPTWGPNPTFRRIGPQIDHVFATDGITAESFGVHDIDGSDHRAVVTTLRLPG